MTSPTAHPLTKRGRNLSCTQGHRCAPRTCPWTPRQRHYGRPGTRSHMWLHSRHCVVQRKGGVGDRREETVCMWASRNRWRTGHTRQHVPRGWKGHFHDTGTLVLSRISHALEQAPEQAAQRAQVMQGT